MTSIGNQTLPSVINNPFAKTKVRRIYVSYGDGLFNTGWSARGSIEFVNGNTEGEQKFEAATFDDVVLQIKQVLGQLQ